MLSILAREGRDAGGGELKRGFERMSWVRRGVGRACSVVM